MRRICFPVLAVTVAITALGCGRAAPPPAAPAAPAGQTDNSTAVDTESVSSPTAGPVEDSASTSSVESAPNGFESPEAAFTALQQSLSRRDWRTATTCLTPESREVMAAGLLFAGGLMAAFGGEEASPITAVMEKHGIELPEPEFSFSVGPPAGDAAEESAEEPEEMPEIEDPAGFIADMLATLESMEEVGPNQKLEQWTSGGLQDLMVEGDEATATIGVKEGEEEEREEIAFRRTAGGWLVHLDEEAFTLEEASASDFPTPPGEESAGPLEEIVLEEGLTATLDLSFEEPFEPQFFGQDFAERTLFATATLQGEPILSAYEYGEFRIDSATDSTGQALELAAPPKDKFNEEFGEKFVELDSFFLDEADTLPMLFALTPPAEDAEWVTIEATLKLKNRESIVIENVLESLDGELEDERLAELGTFRVKRQSEDNGDPENGLVVEFKGDDGGVESIDLLDGEGQPLDSAGQFSFGFGSERTFSIDTGEKLPEDTQLRITLGGTEKILVVPLKFEEVALP